MCRYLVNQLLLAIKKPEIIVAKAVIVAVIRASLLAEMRVEGFASLVAELLPVEVLVVIFPCNFPVLTTLPELARMEFLFI